MSLEVLKPIICIVEEGLRPLDENIWTQWVIIEEDGQQRTTPVQVDLEDLAATRPRREETRRPTCPRLLDALVLNVGLGVGKLGETSAGGIECHMQVNAWGAVPPGHDAPARVARHARQLQSSELHRGMTGGVGFRSLAEVNTDAGPAVLYNRSKLAQALLARALHRRKLAGRLGLVSVEGAVGHRNAPRGCVDGPARVGCRGVWDYGQG